ncbi:hypothetical protein IFM89_010987 [Coptis chinensis]|uniref:Uncharacterized protein n=1 Tax=Coptis chinensis TaxID=261450 RepID=A0A835IQ34_9MAGN|nr:hypothetical protein IFM89_010987 [Coptis chinensis]
MSVLDQQKNPDDGMGDYTEDDEVRRLDEPSIYNKDGLLEKHEDIRWLDVVEWIHKLTIYVINQGNMYVNYDLARKLAFYNLGLQGTRKAFEKLEKLLGRLPFLRPCDYYAEIVKTDTQMEKVKTRLLVEKKNIEKAKERRKAREAKKISEPNYEDPHNHNAAAVLRDNPNVRRAMSGEYVG